MGKYLRKMNRPYQNLIDSNYISSRHVQIRWKKTLNFLRKDTTITSGLDVGDKSPMTEKLGLFFGCKFKSFVFTTV